VVASTDDVAREYADAICEASPARATYLGRTEHDHRLGEHTPAAVDAFGSRVRALRAELARAGDDGVEAQALDAALSTELLEIDDEQQWRRNPEALLDMTLSACAAVLVRDTGPLSERLEAVRYRLLALPAYLEGAWHTWSDVPRFWSEAGAATARAGAAFVRDDIPAASSGAPPALSRSVREAADPAADALDGIAARLLELPDQGSWVAGEAALERRLRVQHQLSDGPAAIAERGEALVAETVAALEELDPRWRDLISSAKSNHPPVGQLLDRYRDEMQRAQRFVEAHGLARATATPLEVRASPRFWADLVPYAAYDPPGWFQPDTPGVFWVTVPAGPDASERLPGHAEPSILFTVVHEGYPGHHLQLTRSNEAGLAPTLVESPLLAEGWAFYCEQMLGEVGYYGDDRVVRAFQLKDQLWRAVRVVVDMGLHTGAMSIDEAVDQLVRVADLEQPSAVAEVRRYTSTPTYQICYAIGKQEIMRLREHRRRVDPGFSLGGFHDELLSYGTIPVPLIASAMQAPRDPQ
jgi:hypothetical protein